MDGGVRLVDGLGRPIDDPQASALAIARSQDTQDAASEHKGHWSWPDMETQRAVMSVHGQNIENLLSCAMYMIPIGESEDERERELGLGFGIQAVQSLVECFTLYRTVILRKPEAVPVTAAGQELVVLRRRYTAAAFSLRTIKAMQVLIEMRVLQTRGPAKALQACMAVEAAKLGLKLCLQSMMPLTIYVDEDAIEEAEPPEADASKQTDEQQQVVQPELDTVEFVGSRSGKRLPALGSSESQAKSTGGIEPLRPTGCKLNWQVCLAEAMHHARPFVHLMALMRRGSRSWLAWSIAILMDFISYHHLRGQVRNTSKSRAERLELAEVSRRRKMVLWAFARSPFFDKYLLYSANRLDSIIRRIPVLNIFNPVEIFLALRHYYFYLSMT